MTLIDTRHLTGSILPLPTVDIHAVIDQSAQESTKIILDPIRLEIIEIHSRTTVGNENETILVDSRTNDQTVDDNHYHCTVIFFSILK